jgi:hypothetical protein
MDSDSKNEATVTIRTSNGVTRYHVMTESAQDEKHLRSVLSAGLEMACALLNAVFRKVENDN